MEFLYGLHTKMLYLPSLFQNCNKNDHFNGRYVLYCHIYLTTTNYCRKTVGTKTVLDRPPWETVRLYQSCVASRTWDSINYLWDWPLMVAFARWPKCQVQLTALGQVGKLRLEIRYIKKLKCRCPLSDVTIEVLRMYTEHNHMLGPMLDSEWRNHI